MTAETTTQKLEQIIARMQQVQRAIRASRQPPSRLELEELQQLGREYARVVEQLAEKRQDNGPA